ncbi:MAG: YraN family protein [Tannerella sp.]|jgi:putative endonuclease|nr:YraN family protein [Tannerella sp.]
MSEKYETGKTGEEGARDYLESLGYKILDMNWHFHHFELDIVADNGEELVVIEVKTRSDNFLIAPELAIDKPKIRRIVAAADAYSQIKKIDKPVRFDIICLIKKGDEYKVETHLEDAFFAPLKQRRY